MRIMILGAGAIGSWLGTCIGRSGHAVTMVGRRPFVDTVSSAGLQVQWPDGRSWQTNNVRPVLTAAEAQSSQGMYQASYDAILVCVKAYAVDQAIRELSQHQVGMFKPDDDG